MRSKSKIEVGECIREEIECLIPDEVNGRHGFAKLTRDRLRDLLTAIACGQSGKDSCALAGISYSTLCSWKNTLPWLDESLECAAAMFRRGMVNIVASAAMSDPYLALSILERIDPERWGRQQRFQVNARVQTIDEALEMLDRQGDAPPPEAQSATRFIV